MKVCPACGRRYPAEYAFCTADATPLRAVEEAPVSPAARVAPVGAAGRSVPPHTGTRPAPRRTQGAVAALVAFGVVTGGYAAYRMWRNHASRTATGSSASAASFPISDAGWNDFVCDAPFGEGFTVRLPPGWIRSGPADGENGPDFLRWRFSCPREPGVTVTADIDRARHGQPALAAWEDLDGRFARAYAGRYTRVALQTTTMDGEPATVWTFRLRRKGQPEQVRMDYGVTFPSGRGFALLLSAPADQAVRWQPVFERIGARLSWHGD